MRRRRRELAAVAAAHRIDRVGGADQRRQRHVGGMRIADRVILHRAQPKPLRGVVGGLLQPPIVEHQRFGLAVFQEQFAIVGPLQPARHLMADGIAVEIGAVEQGGGGGHGAQFRCGRLESKIVAPRSFREGRNRTAGRGPWLCRWILFRLRKDISTAFTERSISSRGSGAISRFWMRRRFETMLAFVLEISAHGYPRTGRGVGRPVRRLVRCGAQAKADLCPWRRSRHGPAAGIPGAVAGRSLDPADLAAAGPSGSVGRAIGSGKQRRRDRALQEGRLRDRRLAA